MREWTCTEVRILRSNASKGLAEITRLLNEAADEHQPPLEHRTPRSVKQAAARLRISLRMEGSCRGLVMGQPRDVSLADIREDMLDPKVAQLVDERARIRDDKLELCPRCGWRPTRVRATGLCGVCHANVLREGHEEVLAELAASRDLDAARQRKSRALKNVKASADRVLRADS